MSCALWLKNYGLSPIIIESSSELGGMQNLSYVSNTWLLGWQAVRGRDLAEKFSAHIHYEKIQVLFNTTIISIDHSKYPDRIIMSLQIAGERIVALETMAVVIATGTRFKGNDWTKDRIFFGPATYSDPTKWFGERPLIVGGGDSALECACFLADRGMNSTVIVRGSSMRATRGNIEKFSEYKSAKKVDLVLNDEVVSVRRDSSASSMTIGTKLGQCLHRDSILLMFGYSPNSDQFKAELFGERKLKTDVEGYISINADCLTSLDRIYAIGDVANPKDPCTATAIAMGTVAARHIVNTQTNETAKRSKFQD
jgi:thioredoxin reductase (NADPH)